MKKVNLGLLIATAALFTTGCPYLTSFLTPTPIASTIVFADGAAVAKQLGSGEYTNAATGIGDPCGGRRKLYPDGDGENSIDLNFCRWRGRD
jgi:hypothetical protein